MGYGHGHLSKCRELFETGFFAVAPFKIVNAFFQAYHHIVERLYKFSNFVSARLHINRTITAEFNFILHVVL